jgi:uncharacterized membrane protein
MGWFSLGLGTLQLVAPDAVNRLCGLPVGHVRRTTQRMIGVRELLAAGGLLLTHSNRSGWMKARVVGDITDISLLTKSLESSTSRTRTSLAMAAVVGVTAIDLIGARRSHILNERTNMQTRAAITINMPRDEVYSFWRDFTNLPRFMQHLESVEIRDDRHSHWKAKAPVGKAVEWDAVVTEEVQSARIAWKSEGETPVPNSGTVEFTDAPGAQGTEVTVSIEYEMPAGNAGKAAAKLLGEDPTQQVRDDLRHFKQVMETGEIVYSEANPAGSQVKRFVKQRPAQPLTDRELATVGGGH